MLFAVERDYRSVTILRIMSGESLTTAEFSTCAYFDSNASVFARNGKTLLSIRRSFAHDRDHKLRALILWLHLTILLTESIDRENCQYL